MPPLEPRISAVTLGARDLDRSLRFYRDLLGWRTKAKRGDPIVFFDLGGTVLALFGRSDLAKDARVGSAGRGFRGFTLAHNVRRRADVDRIFRRLRAGGAKIVKAPRLADWGGYSGYFADPDGNLWEVAFNPGWPIGPDGRVRLE